MATIFLHFANAKLTITVLECCWWLSLISIWLLKCSGCFYRAFWLIARLFLTGHATHNPTSPQSRAYDIMTSKYGSHLFLEDRGIYLSILSFIEHPLCS